ncbi:nucleotide-binding universal stress UspA family protein [Streptomyces sp. B4I13]|uniref:universal stress protein n=1 Tax=Streptomyces sp. B4I13 TaxID=3042271 RepID=UPI0027832109|nr:universal stress protein [Streptomyces sp. B4I13]MDQ0958105.1 nucleotide-binding universal stress UspA family protein [Streptomyces sp. B4I13]
MMQPIVVGVDGAAHSRAAAVWAAGEATLRGLPLHLVQVSSSADLLVVGRSGTTLGPTLHAVLEHTACPVAIVPSRS